MKHKSQGNNFYEFRQLMTKLAIKALKIMSKLAIDVCPFDTH